MLDLGTVRPGSTIRIPFSTFDKDDGSSITMTNFTTADILVYKDGSTTERASTNGYTATTDFDSKTGKHLIVIDLADNTTSGFWNAGSEYHVAIDSVTVDAVSVGGWVARFKIGYVGAMLDTTIASLSSQTSFTLTNGPAEDDALNGCEVIIHDIASAVQCGKAIVDDYTGSTKTVTLVAGTTFTAATGDNISVLWAQPLQPTAAGRKLDVSTGGEAGLDWANIGSPTTAVNLSATNFDVDQVVASVSGAVGSVTGAVGSVTGNVGGNVTGSVGSVVGAVGSVTGNVGGNVTGSVGSIASGGISSASFAAGAIDAAAIATDAITSAELATSAVTELVDAIWNAQTGTYGTSGSYGALLETNLDATISSRSTLTQTQVTGGAYSIQSSSCVLGDARIANLDATVSSRLASASYTAPPSAATISSTVWAESTRSLTILDEDTTTLDLDATIRAAVGLAFANLDTQLDALPTAAENTSAVWANGTRTLTSLSGLTVDTVTTVGTVNALANNSVTAAALAADAITEIQSGLSTLTSGQVTTAVWDAQTGSYGTAGSYGNLVETNLDTNVGSRASQASVNTIDDLLDTEIAAIKLVTDRLNTALQEYGTSGTYQFTVIALENGASGSGGGTDWTTNERTAIRTILGFDASGVVGDPTSGILDTIRDATTTLQTSINTVDDFLDTEILAIKAKTDQLVFAGGYIQANAAEFGGSSTPVARLDSFLDSYVNNGYVDSNIVAVISDAFVPTYLTNMVSAYNGGTLDVRNVTGTVATVNAFAANSITASALAADAGTEIGTAVWATTTRLLTAGTNIVLAKGTGVTGFNDLSAAQVNAEVDTGIADVGLTTTVTGRIDAAISTRASQTSIDTIDDFLDTEIAAIKSKTDLIPTDPADASDITAQFATVNSGISALALSIDAVPTNTELAAAIITGLTTALTEGYRGTAAEGSVRDLLYEIMNSINDFSISGTLKTTRKLNGTPAKTYTLNDGVTPTGITETS